MSLRQPSPYPVVVMSVVAATLTSAVILTSLPAPTVGAAPVTSSPTVSPLSSPSRTEPTTPSTPAKKPQRTPTPAAEDKPTWDPFDKKPPERTTVDTVENSVPLLPDDSSNRRCERDPLASNFQRCFLYSASNKRLMPIHFKPAAQGSRAAVLLLDGASARDGYNRWINRGAAASTTAGTNINVIAPIGGGASWYTDWTYPNWSPVHPTANPQNWETFLTVELPRWAARHANIDPRLYSVVGFSMGGGSAMMLAEQHPRMFRQAMSFSGMLSYSIPGAQAALNFMGDLNVNPWAPFGTAVNPARYRKDPTLNVEKLRGIDVYASSYNGTLRKNRSALAGWNEFVSLPWEWGTLIMLKNFERAAQQKKVPITAHYLGAGSHEYEAAARELRAQLPRVLRVMGQAEKQQDKQQKELRTPGTQPASEVRRSR